MKSSDLRHGIYLNSCLDPFLLTSSVETRTDAAVSVGERTPIEWVYTGQISNSNFPLGQAFFSCYKQTRLYRKERDNMNMVWDYNEQRSQLGFQLDMV